MLPGQQEGESMKVYELVAELMKLPAGLTVRIGGIVTDKELDSTKIDETEEKGAIYSRYVEALEIEADEEAVTISY